MSADGPAHLEHTDIVDEDAPGMPISVPDSGDTGEGGKLKMIVQLVKKCLGVKDIAAMRLSLPASLLEPIPNLEYWHYLDRPDIFAAINDSNDPFERMLAVVRFTFTKDLKFIKGGVVKPYNSVLGEHFRAHWDIVPLSEDISESPTPSGPSTTGDALNVDAASLRSSLSSSKSAASGLSVFSRFRKGSSTAATSPQAAPADEAAAQMSNLNLASEDDTAERLRVVYVTEQVSHHPPVSAYYAACPTRSIELRGIDQISAKVSGTSLRVSPGEYNQGLFISLTGGPGEGEQYKVTHPVASVNGILRGSFYVTVGDSTIITCAGGKTSHHKFRTIIEYKEESWLGKAHYLVEGVVHTISEGDTQYEQWTKVKQVPNSHIVAVFDGSWRGQIRWRRVGLGSYPHTSSVASSPSPSHTSLAVPAPSSAKSASKADVVLHDEEYTTLIDLSTLDILPKKVRPREKQLPHESQKLWAPVTDNLIKKEFSEATKQKIVIEQKQRDDAAERKKKGVQFVPRYFEKDMSKGWSALSEEGWKAVEEELNEDSAFCIEGSENAKLAP